MCKKKSQHSISDITAIQSSTCKTLSGAAALVLSLQHIPGSSAAAPLPWRPSDATDCAKLSLPRAVSAAVVYSETQNKTKRHCWGHDRRIWKGEKHSRKVYFLRVHTVDA